MTPHAGECYFTFHEPEPAGGTDPSPAEMIDTVILTQDFAPAVGGTQTYALEIARRLAVHGRVRVIAPKGRGTDEIDRALDFEVDRVPFGTDAFYLTARAAVRRATEDGFGRAFCVQWTAALAALYGRRLVPLFKVFVAAHGRELLFNPFPGPLGRYYARQRRHALRSADGVFPVSRYTAGLVRDLGVPADRIHVVPNGADHRRFRPSDRVLARRAYGLGNDPVLLTLCRLVPRKGVDVVLRAFRHVLESRPCAVLLVAGDGPERTRLEALSGELGVASRVRFLGSVRCENLTELFATADAFVLVPREAPPDVEGFGLVFLEASACEIPVVGSRSGGIPDAVLDGVTGLLVNADDADGLAGVLEYLLDNPDIARTLGQDGRRHVIDFGNWDRAVDMLLTGFGDA